LPGVNEQAGITFISQDLDAIRGLKDTNVRPGNFTQLAQSAPRSLLVDEQGNVVLDDLGNPTEVLISPLIRLEDRFRLFRNVTEDPPVFPSGQGPRAYFIPSDLLPQILRGDILDDTSLVAGLFDERIQPSDDFWVFGEFVIEDQIRPNFANSFGGILWEGYIIPNPSASISSYTYSSSGLFHVEYDRFDDGNWTVLKSIYAKKRSVFAQFFQGNTTTIQLQEGDARFVSVGDFLEADSTNTILSISGNQITISKPLTVAGGQELVFDMDLGQSTVSGSYSIDAVLDRGETPQIRKRIFWWFPDDQVYDPSLKYLRNGITGRSTYDFFFWNKDPAALTPRSGSVRELLETATSPSQSEMGGSSNYRELKTRSSAESLYVPKSSLAQVTLATITVSFIQNNRFIQGSLATTELGNLIVPVNTSEFGVAIPKDMRIRDLTGSNVDSAFRIVSKPFLATRSSSLVRIIDHNGLIDYFVSSSSGDVATVSDTSKLKVGMICITNSTGPTAFVRITEIISETQIRTSENLSISNAYLFVYANAGIVDRSLDKFCVGVFGKTVAETASVGSNQIELSSIGGIEEGQVVQFENYIPDGTTVLSIAGSIITLSANIIKTINPDETIVFAPAGTDVNKEICVLPLDLSPPFIGIDTGLSTNGKNVASSLDTFNLKFGNLDIREAPINTADVSETYDHKVSVGTYSVIAKKI
jgi:hypothetical protein